jgi:hypothetical protein
LDDLAFSKAGGAGPKSLRKGIRSIEDRIREHEEKIKASNDPDLIEYWKREIEVLAQERERKLRRLGRA